jgi:hypothetical protein
MPRKITPPPSATEQVTRKERQQEGSPSAGAFRVEKLPKRSRSLRLRAGRQRTDHPHGPIPAHLFLQSYALTLRALLLLVELGLSRFKMIS